MYILITYYSNNIITYIHIVYGIIHAYAYTIPTTPPYPTYLRGGV